MLHDKWLALAGLYTVLSALVGCAGSGTQIVRETVVVTQVVTQPAPTATATAVEGAQIAEALATTSPTGTWTLTPTVSPAQTPTGAASATPPPSPTAPIANLPPFDGGMNITQIGPNDTDTTVTTALVFEAQANDVHVGDNNGDGIARIEFSIFDGKQLVYAHTETKVNYCAFGGGDPDCAQLILAQVKTWPGTNIKIHNGKYILVAKAFTPDGRSRQADATINIQMATTKGSVQVRIVQTGPNTNSTTVQGTLVFQALASDINVGRDDGAGIDYIEMFVLDSSGQTVHYRKEKNAKYCAFGGGSPNCNLYKFADHGNKWDDDAKTPIQKGGQYTLRAVAHAVDGTIGMTELLITIQY